MDKNYSGSLALTKLAYVKMEMKGKNGMVEGLFIPIDANYLVRGKEKDGVVPIYMPVNVKTKAEVDQYGQNGFIGQQVDSKIYKAASAEEKEIFNKLPILGNIKDFTGGGDDTAGAASTKTFTPEDDDLPF